VTTVFCVALTVAAYSLSRRIGRRYSSPLTVPVFLATSMVMVVLVATGLDLDGYAHAKSFLAEFLGPATVALADPLYRNRRVLIDHARPVVVGLVVGAVASMVAAVGAGALLGLDRGIRAALAIRSVTAPVAIELAGEVDADPTVVAAFVILTGLVGSMIGPCLLTRIRVGREIARGEALGTVSHGQGTAQALTESDATGAAASVAMGSVAVVVSLLAPVAVRVLL